MSGYYHDIVTEKSWQVLQQLQGKIKFVLIGGWAVYLYTKNLKSKDIDLIAEYEELQKLKQDFEVNKNERLKKYEARTDVVQIDVYVPFYSNPGLPAEEVVKQAVSVQGFMVPKPEILAILKQNTLLKRQGTPKGRKDLLDLVSLLRLPGFDFKTYGKELLLARELIKEVRELPELNLNTHLMAKLKKNFYEHW